MEWMAAFIKCAACHQLSLLRIPHYAFYENLLFNWMQQQLKLFLWNIIHDSLLLFLWSLENQEFPFTANTARRSSSTPIHQTRKHNIFS